MSNYSVATAIPTTTTGVMTVATRFIPFSTQGNGDIVNITAELKDLLVETGLVAGTATVFAPGATAAITTLEFEPGVVHDFQRLFDQIAAPDQDYEHNVRLGDGNGHSHCRAGLLGPSLVVPFVNGRFALGTWQSVCFVCFDNGPRDRKVVVQFVGV
jgi:secondary thiamine-phosphate synthase enzyme